jgi:gephyrin
LFSKDALRNAFDSASAKADVIITTGGVSMGEKDYIKSILAEVGATLQFGRVNMKPGKPTTFATIGGTSDKLPKESVDEQVGDQQSGHVGSKLFFGLPGNPVSALVSLHLFVIPALKRMSGHAHPDPTIIKAKVCVSVVLALISQLAHAFSVDPVRPEYHRVRFEFKSTPDGLIQLMATSTGSQRSSTLLSLQGADGFVILPAARDTNSRQLLPGTTVDAFVIQNIFSK